MSDSSTPPPKPWHRGAEYNYTEITVRVVETQDGWVFSEHDFASREDAESASKMQNGGGVKQLAYALTTEALRRETFLCFLVELSARPEALQRYMEGDDECREAFLRNLSNAALATIMGVSRKALPSIAREVLHMVLQQVRGVEDPFIG